MTTTEVRREPPHVGRRPEPTRGPLVAAAVVLLLWGVWLLVPHTARLELLGGPAPAGPARPGDAPAGDVGAADPAGRLDAADPVGDEPVAPAADPAAADPAAEGAGAAAADPAAEGAGAAAADPAAAADAAADAAQPAAAVEVPVAGDGTFAVAPGQGDVVGQGRLVRYTVEVEGGVPVDVAEVAATVEAVLADPRSWTAEGRWSLQRVDADPDARIVVASPDTTDRMCAPLRTRGQVSCRNGRDVVLNAVRWTQGAQTWGTDVAGYRQYVVNHELGHFLGNGHVRCPEEGTAAPVMLQQTLGLQGCLPNAWPYP